MNLNAIYRKNPGVAARKIAGETLLVPVKGNLADMQRIFILDGVGEYIWNRLDDDCSLLSILNDIVNQFNVAESQAGSDFRQFVDELLVAELIEDKVS